MKQVDLNSTTSGFQNQRGILEKTESIKELGIQFKGKRNIIKPEFIEMLAEKKKQDIRKQQEAELKQQLDEMIRQE